MSTRPFTSLVCAFTVVCLGPAVGRADPFIFTNEHVDIDLRFENGALGIGWHDETNDLEYEAHEALVRVPLGAIMPRPGDPAFNFIGVGAGQPIWLLPQNNNPSLVFLGFGSEEIAETTFEDFTGDGIGDLTVELVAVRGPGAASAWASVLGSPQVKFASADGLPDSFLFPAGSHQHFNFAFTAPGRYELDFTVSGTLAGGGQAPSGAATLVFDIQQVEAVPAPATAFVLAALLPLLAVRRRTARQEVTA